MGKRPTAEVPVILLRKGCQWPNCGTTLDIEVVEKNSSGAKEKSSSGKGTIGPLTAHFSEKEKRESLPNGRALV